MWFLNKYSFQLLWKEYSSLSGFSIKSLKRKSKLLKSFLRFPHINRTVSDRETYISALRNLRFCNGKRKK